MSLYAALDLTTGKVIGKLHSRRRAIEFEHFFVTIDEAVPKHLDVHLVLDNASTHKTPTIQRWLKAHPRFVLHFIPTSSSWLNLVERWFGELTTKKLKRYAHRSVRALSQDIRAWIGSWNENPQPYVWQPSATNCPSHASTSKPTLAGLTPRHRRRSAQGRTHRYQASGGGWRLA